MKRFLAVLLVLYTLLSLFPISFSAQAETLAKDESGAEAVPDTALSNGAVLTKYDALYVGVNGAKTANGRSLLGLYTAFGVDSSAVTPSNGTGNGLWKNKMDVTGGTDAVLRDAYTGVDFMLGVSGGVGYHMTATEWTDGAKHMGITLPAAWADLSDFTVEQVALQDAIASTSSLAKVIHAVRLDLLISVWLPADGTSNTSGKIRLSPDDG